MVEPPPEVIQAARGAPEMRVPGSVVADLSYDSLLDGADPTSRERRLTFATPELEVRLTVRPHRAGVRVLVRLEPDAEATVRPFHDPRTQSLPSAGVATLLVPRGLTSLVIERSGTGTAVIQTAWLSL